MRRYLMLPRVKEMVQLVKGNSEEELLIAYGKTERVRTWLASDDFRNDMEIFGQLIDLLEKSVRKGARRGEL